MKESTWLITIHYQISTFQVKPLATIRCSRERNKTSCSMLSNPLASSSLPKREVWKCFKSSLHSNLFSMLIFKKVALFGAEPGKIFAKFSHFRSAVFFQNSEVPATLMAILQTEVRKVWRECAFFSCDLADSFMMKAKQDKIRCLL